MEANGLAMCSAELEEITTLNKNTETMSTDVENIKDEALHIGGVICSITISNGRNDNYRQFKSNSNWFSDSEYYTLNEEDGCLTINKHYMEVPKNAQKTNRGYFHCVSAIPLGQFEFDDEESTEDQLVIYYR